MAFDPDRLAEECRTALSDATPQAAVRDALARSIADGASVVRALGEPTCASVQSLFRSSELTILNVVWGPNMVLRPHNHNMWAINGVYGGREDNIFWRRHAERPTEVVAAGAKSLCNADTITMGRDIIHSVVNPISGLSGTLHIYGGDFFDDGERSEWDPETLREQPFATANTLQAFESCNRIYGLPRD